MMNAGVPLMPASVATLCVGVDRRLARVVVQGVRERPHVEADLPRVVVEGGALEAR